MDAIAQLNAALAGRYDIERELGAGGMATVYLAHDLRHERHVALKVLRPDLGAVLGPERFLTEIRVTARLQHPNLLPLFDSGEAAPSGYEPGPGLLYYVMPYVDGESLRATLSREKQLSIDDALHIALGVASALDYAHRHGIVHRDLKPENILLQGGEPMVADFGIALAVTRAGGERITQTGISLGTPQYMSPEQATGDRDLDGRVDIYSLGAVLYEMLTGEPPHLGGTAQAVIARVITETPRSMRVIRPSVPAHVDAAVARALEKLPADRFATAHEFAEALQGRLAEGLGTATPPAASRRWARGLLWTLAVAGIIAGTVTGVVLDRRTRSTATAPVVRAGVALPRDVPLILGTNHIGYNSPLLDISPDGRQLVYAGKSSTGELLYVRDLATGGVRALAGTDGALHPFFSPDGQWIAFLTADHVKKVPTQGGAVVTLCAAAQPVLGRWLTPGTIYFTEDETVTFARVSADGGTPERLVRATEVKVRRFSDILPDGRLIGDAPGSIGGDFHDIILVDGKRKTSTVLLHRGFGARYVGPGFLLFGRAGSLMAVRFDPSAGHVQGEPVAIAAGAAMESAFGILQGAASQAGVLAYVPGGDLSVGRLAWVDQRGAVQYVDTTEGLYGSMALSPDGRRLAIQVADVNDYVWLLDLAKGEGKRVASSASEAAPRWTRDGKSLVSTHMQHRSIFVRDLLPSGTVDAPRELALHRASPFPARYTPAEVVQAIRNPHTMFVRVATGEEVDSVPGLSAHFSPDARTVVYSSPQTGTAEIVIRSFPDGRAVGQVSNGGGIEPIWKSSGELYYRNGHRFFVTHVTAGSQPRWDSPHLVFDTDFIDTPGLSYEVSNDGQRLLVVKRVHAVVTSRIELVMNWSALLNQTR